MRVTNKMLTNNYQRNVSLNLKRMTDVNNQIATGKTISRPSQNPFLATRIMDYDAEIARKEQFERNIEDIDGFLTVTDTAMGQLGDQLTRMKELILKASSGTNSESERQIIKEEVDQLINAMVDTLNTSYEDKYVFSGYQTDTCPFELVHHGTGNREVVYHGDGNIGQVEISKGVTVFRNVSGDEVLGSVNGRNLFESMIAVSDALKANDVDALNALIEDIDGHQENSLRIRGKVGAQQNRLEMALDRNRDEVLNLKTVLSEAEDVDYAEAMITYSILNASYKASLQISSSVIQPTLLDFLR